ncbi:MAG: AAA domain-containing protein [Deltaproteobacteria bacterium]|nr:AAA domain-containing protein [Deltaproteobacteria bacterium]
MNAMHDEIITGELLNILKISPVSLSTNDISTRLRFCRLRLSDYEVGFLLRNLLNEGKVEFNMGRWTATVSPQATLPPSYTAFPPLCKETLSILGMKDRGVSYVSPLEDTDVIESETEDISADIYSGRWGTFRRLLRYYRQCIQQEEGADASAFQNEMGRKFLYLRRVGWWHPRPSIRWQTIVPLGPYLSPLLNALPGPNEDQSLVLGYPIQAYFKEKEDEPNVAVIRPIYFFNVEVTVGQNCLVISCEDPRPEVNLGWLEYAFLNNLDRQRGFLSACGFLNPLRPFDEPPGLEPCERVPSLESLVAALAAFMPEKVQEPLHIENVPGEALREPFPTGIYNRAVIMLAKKTRYTATLLKELAAIEQAPDEFLDRTALRHIFISDSKQGTSTEILHEAIVADTALLNAEQRSAIASLLINNITVVTGPPGTGKSQVVGSTIINARLRNQTVLFASRNHKAIDAVVGRLYEHEQRPLIVRTNSKDDPSINYTFAHAIQDMLVTPRCPESSERLQRAQEELFMLLDDRGRKASFARRAAEAATALGELEERRSYIAKSLPEEMALFLDSKPELFPTKALQRVLKTLHRLCLRSPYNPPKNGLSTLFRLLWILPSYKTARRRLCNVPMSPALPSFPWPLALKASLSDFLLLEQAMEYARLRIECRPYEATLAQLPQMEDTVSAIYDLSKRIEQVADRAISLDLDSRTNLDEGINREELAGLRAALKAMRTGLDEDYIRRETTRVLEERVGHILKAFPCWAVTNLSAGSRIPLIAGLFDLAVIDEASQSDIPSAIPILFRARRAGVVGDPFQLSHTSRLTTARDTMLRRKVGLKRVDDLRFAYTESSLYNLFAATNAVSPVFLSETYRSAEEIANYSSHAFYSGRLRVCTDESRLLRPRGVSLGIHWTEITGEIQSGGGSGCYCREEVDEILRLMRVILLENNFLGTVGVVTPFRQQANRLRDALFESDTRLYEALVRAKVHIDTAHGFQGDERDVIVFSLCAGPDMPTGSRSFLRETGNLFNVAVSRARAVLHVVGNREWAKRCGIRHVEDLALPRERASGVPPHGPWHPHESPWEEKLYKALLEVGLEPRPQFPVSGRRLDLALVRDGDRPAKIDIEVDGDCHRNPDGTRKIDDLWRDIQLQGMGWKVLRFWTYMLREDMGACVDKILKAWSES